MCAARTYFKCGTGAAKPSSRSLADLNLGTSGDDTAVHKLLATLPVKHPNEKEQINLKHAQQFATWLFHLRQGFSLLFYGFGSKRQLLENFASSLPAAEGVLAVDGMHPGLSAKQVLLKVACQLRRSQPSHFRGLTAAGLLDSINQINTGQRICVVLHNIDGPGLRGAEAQALLAELAAAPAVRLVASLDHVSGALLWDRQRAARFNWLWLDVTNYAPYAAETRDIPSLLIGRREEASQRGAAVVLRTLVPDAREVFRLMAQHQQDDPAGIAFQTLFRRCRERFLVSNDQTLKAHLAEFRDHELVVTKRGQDGADLLVIPLPPDTLAQVLTDMDAAPQ